MVDFRPSSKVSERNQGYALPNVNIDSQRLDGKRYSGLVVPNNYLRERKTVFHDDIHVQALSDRFEGEKDWIDTEYGGRLFEGWYKEIFQGAFKNRTFKEFRDHRLKAWDEIFADIKNNGFKKSTNVYDNIEVSVAKDGRLLFVDGRHRLYFAKLLKIDRIPVIVNHWSLQFVRKAKTLNAKKLIEIVESHQDR